MALLDQLEETVDRDAQMEVRVDLDRLLVLEQLLALFQHILHGFQDVLVPETR